MHGPAPFELLGIVNVTPDSFSDGGRFLLLDSAVAQARRLASEGADWIDVGGESTRPGSEPVDPDEERRRIVPVIERVAAFARVSVDTSKLAVATDAVAAGAALINDTTAFRHDPELAGFVADHRLRCCLMHMQGEPRTMQASPTYGDVVDDVKAFLTERMEFAVREGVREDRIVLDPGIGFGKTVTHNLTLLRRIGEIVALGRPVLVGTSRKRFLGVITGRTEPADRSAATIATCVQTYLQGATMFRVHDVAPTRDALAVAAATVRGRWDETTIPQTTTTTRTT